MNWLTHVFIVIAFTLVSTLNAAHSKEPPTPVVIIPGILGSKLQDKTTKKIIWGEGSYFWNAASVLPNLERLEIKTPSDADRAEAIGLIDKIEWLGPLWVDHYYDTLINFLKENGYSDAPGPSRTLYVFPYDWRRSNSETAQLFSSYIDKNLKDRKFDIIAHSMGGIVSRLFIEKDNQLRVRKLIYLGTPFFGSMNTLATLSDGWNWFENELVGGRKVIQGVILSFPAFLELLPQYVYNNETCCVLKLRNGSRVALDVLDLSVWLDRGWLPAEYRYGSKLEAFKAALINARRVNAIVSVPAPNSVEETIIAASAHQAKIRLGMSEGSSEPTPDNWKFTEDLGDGTVPVWSAARNKDFDLLSGILPSYAEHSIIFADKDVLDTILRVLTRIEPAWKQPIKKEDRITLLVKDGDQQRAWTINNIKFEASPPAQKPGQKVRLDIKVEIDKAAMISIGKFLPEIYLDTNQGPKRLGPLSETTSKEELDNRRLSFSVDFEVPDVNELIDIRVQITDKLVAHAYVLPLN